MEIISLACAYSSQKHIAVLAKGGIVIYPSSNCYGICCDIFHQKAVDTISAIKNRDRTKPYTILVRDKKHFAEYGKYSQCIDYYLGKHPSSLFTFVVPSLSAVPQCLNAGCETIGIMVARGIEHTLFCAYPHALINTSANRSSMPTCFDIAHISEQLGDSLEYVDLVIDGGVLMPAASSTIIKICGDKHEVLRGSIQ
ncbi:MAG: L-threonylcarbamoyladenylate synthase [Candidatus Omnitrophica bacterium]|nr:L-threonylcarbamoyladenylate synthase [Candidatus Omnitrophota bacterium]